MRNFFGSKALTDFSKLILSSVLLFCLLLLSPERASAVIFSGSQVASDQWIYDLTYEPLDNYSITQQFTTITLTGLFGVTAAFGPVSTDFPNSFINDINLDWSAEVLDGGTSVRWTRDAPGTGNFSYDITVYGFSVIAPGALDGLASFATDGFSTDSSYGTQDRDIAGFVSGPVAPAPVPEPGTLLLFGSGLAGLTLYRRRMNKL